MRMHLPWCVSESFRKSSIPLACHKPEHIQAHDLPPDQLAGPEMGGTKCPDDNLLASCKPVGARCLITRGDQKDLVKRMIERGYVPRVGQGRRIHGHHVQPERK